MVGKQVWLFGVLICLVGCSADTSIGVPAAGDCRSNSAGCNEGFSCRQGTDQTYECLPEAETADGGMPGADAETGEASCDDGITNGDEVDVDCGGRCDACADGSSCVESTDCLSGVCGDGTCSEASCDDGIANGNETDVDCGGQCAPCADGLACTSPMDCGSGVCEGERCLAAACADGIVNGDESGVDCGGTCTPCGVDDPCNIAPDCESGVCLGMVCQGASCEDFVQNGDETDVDCGGTCGACADESMCAAGSDCTSQVCGPDMMCAAATCTDTVQNGDETDVDCGGTCGACVDGSMCAAGSDCTSLVCGPDMVCAAATCTDTVQNGDETDVDCGGTCGACADGSMCTAGSDCTSQVCGPDMMCAAATCTDTVQNGDETDVDCGGTCGACADGSMCTAGSDCTSQVCGPDMVCAAATCTDTVQNGDETDVDCGGTCGACADGSMCTAGSDCTSQVCGPDMVCAAATCTDTVQNGDETDVDCGGTCGACADGAMRAAGSDCTSQVCGPDMMCAAATCTDTVQNGDETDVDCGGTCGACVDGSMCAAGSDCTSQVCGPDMMCAAATCTDTVQNGDETDVDCGGTCGACADGAMCAAGSDCTSQVCGPDMMCAAATCTDTVQNGDETDVDCGGTCGACADGAMCAAGSDCTSQVCGPDMMCAAATCTDTVQNGDETDVDCGGRCNACPSCSDGVLNQDETGVDCGGVCAPCAPQGDEIGNTGLTSASGIAPPRAFLAYLNTPAWIQLTHVGVDIVDVNGGTDIQCFVYSRTPGVADTELLNVFDGILGRTEVRTIDSIGKQYFRLEAPLELEPGEYGLGCEFSGASLQVTYEVSNDYRQCFVSDTSTIGTGNLAADLWLCGYPNGWGIFGVTSADYVAPSCNDFTQNGYETFFDCGGPECAPCREGATCVEDSDCESGRCTDGVCIEVVRCINGVDSTDSEGVLNGVAQAGSMVGQQVTVEPGAAETVSIRFGDGSGSFQIGVYTGGYAMVAQTAVHTVERGVVTVDLLDPNDPNTVIGVPGGTYWVMLFLSDESTLIAQSNTNAPITQYQYSGVGLNSLPRTMNPNGTFNRKTLSIWLNTEPTSGECGVAPVDYNTFGNWEIEATGNLGGANVPLTWADGRGRSGFVGNSHPGPLVANCAKPMFFDITNPVVGGEYLSGQVLWRYRGDCTQRPTPRSFNHLFKECFDPNGDALTVQMETAYPIITDAELTYQGRCFYSLWYMSDGFNYPNADVISINEGELCYPGEACIQR